ncbi:MAG: hypothetical protein JSV63_00965 [Candidatus Aenigmatarchaeota archaeon]|nr:MAG: hypothetical protein JSV63_00965 [Candidatus Aenigmarchaeota archaeon]
MSEWGKARGEMKKEFSWMEKLVDGYSYQDPKHTDKTDNKVRTLIADEIKKCRDTLFPMIEAAYLDQDMKSAGPLDDVMQWLDIFLLELGLKMNWSEVGDHRDYMRLIKFDITLIKNAKKLAEILDDMHERVLKRKDTRSVPAKSAQIKKYILDLLKVFKKRRHSLGG